MNAWPTPPLAGYLSSRRWLRRSHPFPHIVAFDVFTPEVYDRLVTRFRQIMAEVGDRSYLDDHDIFGATVTPEIASGLEPFTTRAWHDLLAGLMSVRATGHVAMGMHHHRVGSADGFPHNDVNEGWFAGDPGPDEIELSRPHLVEYTTGNARAAGVHPRCAVRAVAALYYLDNALWYPGAGGVTGLYSRSDAPIRRPEMSVPPLNNSMLIFECTPWSWHGFISNQQARNSIIMWLHRCKSEVISRWGEKAIVPYGHRPHMGAIQ